MARARNIERALVVPQTARLSVEAGTLSTAVAALAEFQRSADATRRKCLTICAKIAMASRNGGELCSLYVSMASSGPSTATGDEARYGNQDTDGSRSTRHFIKPMRDIGAAARMMLEAAAAKRWN
jgi:hypothetical protein